MLKIARVKTAAYQARLKLVEYSLNYFTPMFLFSFFLTGSENQRFSNVLGGRDKKGNLNLNWINFGTYPAGIYLLKVNNRNTRTSVKYVHN